MFIQKRPYYRARSFRHASAEMSITAIDLCGFPAQIMQRVLVLSQSPDEIGLFSVANVNVVESRTLELRHLSSLRPVLQAFIVMNVAADFSLLRGLLLKLAGGFQQKLVGAADGRPPTHHQR